MEFLFFLLISAVVIYLFAQYYPWPGRPKRSLPMSPRGRMPRLQPATPRQALPAPERPPPQRSLDLFNLRKGDVVMHLDRDFLVVRSRHIREDDWEWQDYLLEDGADTFLLSTNDTGDEVFLLEPVALSLPYPPPDTVSFRSQTYTLTSAGQADVVDTGERFAYYTYEAGQKVLVAEDWGGSQFDIFWGEAVYPQDLTFLPGSPENIKNP